MFDTPDESYEHVLDDKFEPMHAVSHVDGYDLSEATPCPFCNRSNVEVRFDPNETRLAEYGYKGEYKVYCKECGSYGPGMPDYDHAVRLWNYHRRRDEHLKSRLLQYESDMRQWLESMPDSWRIING